MDKPLNENPLENTHENDLMKFLMNTAPELARNAEMTRRLTSRVVELSEMIKGLNATNARYARAMLLLAAVTGVMTLVSIFCTLYKWSNN